MTAIPPDLADAADEERRAVEIAAFLRAHPLFLSDRPELYRVLAPPQRLYGERMADHMAAMLRAERAHASAMAERANDVLAAGRAAAGLTGRVQEAVLALLRAGDAVECISCELPSLLGLDSVSLCIEADIAGTRQVEPGSVARLLGHRAMLFRDAPDETRPLHGEAAGLAHRDALVRIPGDGPPALLALAARDAASLDRSQGTGALVFLARAIAARLGR